MKYRNSFRKKAGCSVTAVHFLFFVYMLFNPSVTAAQPNYTDTAFQIRVDSGIRYAIDTNYAGKPDTLLLDIYKPIGDNNRFRPVFVIVHGGYFISGNNRDPEVLILARYFAKRGYVVATINYRKGWHMNPSVPNPIFRDPNPFNQPDYNPQQCLYPADTSELIRANYRGMQDAKSAVRWMRARHLQDSTCLLNYFIGGFSAGGFIALQTAFLDLPTEKPADVLALPDAPNPEPKLAFCNNLNNPSNWVVNKARPDLGSIDGRTNLNGFSSRVKGIANLFGAMNNRNVILGPDTPAIYLYHQECDIVVPYNYYTVNGYLNNYCIPLLGLVPPFFPQYTPITKTPWVHGSKSLEQFFLSLPVSQRPFYKFSDIRNGAPNQLSCVANPPCHSMPYVLAYSDTIARFFKPIVNAAENNSTVNCLSATGFRNLTLNDKVKLFPNPFSNRVAVEFPGNYHQVKYILSDAFGNTMIRKTIGQRIASFSISNLEALPHGIYLLEIFTEAGMIYKKLVK
jgi:alpha/beta superfamily hydrolase